MRLFVLSPLLAFPFSAAAQSVEELRPPIGRRYTVTGTFTGSVIGENVERKYNGDTVTERIDCRIQMTFHEDGTMSYTTRDYLYEKIYRHKTTTGGVEVGRTRLEAEGGSSSKNATLTVLATQYGLVWGATWTPIVEQPGSQVEDAWLEDGLGRTWGHTSKPAKVGPVHCEPRVHWRGIGGKGKGLPAEGTWTGPHYFWRWATVQAAWKFDLPPSRP